MASDSDNIAEEEVSLDEPPDQLYPIPIIPISYEDSDDYAPFEIDDTDQEDML